VDKSKNLKMMINPKNKSFGQYMERGERVARLIHCIVVHIWRKHSMYPYPFFEEKYPYPLFEEN